MTAHGQYCTVRPADLHTTAPASNWFHASVKAFEPSSSFGASLLEALPPIPQSEPTTPALDAASTAMSSPAGTTGTTGVNAPAEVGLGAGLSGVTSPTTGVGIGTSGATGLGSGLSGASSLTTGVRTGAGLGGSFGLSGQPTSSPTTSTGISGLTTLGGGSSIGVGLHPQATSFGVGLDAANPFRASVMTPGTGVGSGAGTLPPFNPANAGANLFSQPTGVGVPSFGQSLFVGAQTDPSKQQNGTASLI